MATSESVITIIAVFLVLASVGAGTLSGNASASPPDLSVKSVTVTTPAYAGQTIYSKAVFVNSGSLSASFVPYKVEFINAQGNAMQTVSDYVTLIANQDTAVDLPNVQNLPAGTYNVRLTLDQLMQVDESNENNNIFEATVVVK